MDTGISLAQFILSSAAILLSAAFGLVKYVDTQTSKAKQEMRAELAELKTQHSATQIELKRISDTLLEIRTLLFGAKGHPGILSEERNK